MNTIQIDACCTELQSYVGTYASDMIPKILPKPYSLILNLDKSTEPGSHWVAICKFNELEVYDTYARENIHQLSKFLKNKKYIANDRIGQSLDSDACGQHCVYYLHCRQSGLKLNQITNSFTDDLSLNDSMVKRWLFSNFKSHFCTSKNINQKCHSFLALKCVN